MLTDTHAHINLSPLYGRWQEVIKEAQTAGVHQFIVPGIDVDSSKTSVLLAEQHSALFAAVGIHPETLLDDPHYNLDPIKAYAHDQRVVAIGEIGLDYFRDHADPTIQRGLFRDQLAIAVASHLPVLIHTRSEMAMNDAFDDIQSVYGSNPFQGIFHCFSGTRDIYNKIFRLGGYIGVGGMITYDHQQELQRLVAAIPLTSIVLETDAPWLMPAPRPRREVNTPANVTIVAAKLAALHNCQLHEVMETIDGNVHRLFPQLGLKV